MNMDLTTSGIEEYWVQRGQALYDVLMRMAAVQEWTVDSDAELTQSLSALSDALESPACLSLMASRPAETVEFLSWLSSPVALRILNAVDEVALGAAARLVYQADDMGDNAVYRLFIEGLEVLSRSRLLAHIFSPDRMALVEAAVKASKAAGE